jgi:23S rRNA pseudouridine1911/1915/1917 synthase
MPRKLRTAAVDAGAPLGAWIAARLGLSAEAARDRVVAGAVYVDGRRVRDAELRLGAGATVVVHEPAAATAGWTIVHQSAALLVVDKPAGLPVVAPRAGGAALDEQVAARVPGALPLHRIDRDTSGLVLFTLDRAARQALTKDLASGRLVRVYLAVVAGAPPDRITLDAPIGPDPADRRRFKADVPGGRRARTEVRVVARGAAATLVEARLVTGLTHQIRVHLAGAGHPILGDALYGGPSAPRLALHAARLEWPGGQATSELPAELAALVNAG